MLQRRGFLVGLVAAPAIVRTPGLLMPVRPLNLDGPMTAAEVVERHAAYMRGFQINEAFVADFTRNVRELIEREFALAYGPS